MRIDLTLDDDLRAKAQHLTGLSDTNALVHEALKALVERESAKRMLLLSGSMPHAEAPPRRRGEK